ncbi:hypothetical protein ABAC460_07040 [Asticcacaulis sp. AC460]|uniref:endonuclease domain-containing protein n=1 Tax=Asticcacaulis sp. AC460 TaxID=1282360 RepID=UPI0003C3C1EC|nr:DUF559 domain-containing protein [Asticcacaulis sp. AC460]ESQ91315.1 hypothetical protein ABAC460_07040 [Asticcacaulis sp. AC460]
MDTTRHRLKYELARRFRRTLTPSETRLWLRLRGNPQGIHFRRQHPIGPYIVDFYCTAASLVVEVDGSVHTEDDKARRDEVSTAWLEAQGMMVFRLNGADVMIDPDTAAEDVLELAAKRITARKPD